MIERCMIEQCTKTDDEMLRPSNRIAAKQDPLTRPVIRS